MAKTLEIMYKITKSLRKIDLRKAAIWQGYLTLGI